MKKKLQIYFDRISQIFKPANPKKFSRLLLIIVASGILLMTLLLFSFVLSVRMGLFGTLPDHQELASIENQTSSEIYASDDELLGKYFIYDRSQLLPNQVSDNLINSLIATEDARFYSHNGIDYRSLMRVFYRTLLLRQSSAGGGSTLSQQLAKNLYPRNGDSFLSLAVDKIREMIIARRLESIYSKNEILLLYLNTVSFGENVYGVTAASLRFFNKNPRDLTIEEAATLTGMLKATSFYNPRLFPQRALDRRNTVIGQLKRYKYINTHQADSIRQLPLELDYTPMSHHQGPAPYFRESARTHITRLLHKYNQENNTQYNLYTDGLKIYTTLDYNLQLIAEKAVEKQLREQQQRMNDYYKRLSRQKAMPLLRKLMLQTQRYQSFQKNNLESESVEVHFDQAIAMEFYEPGGSQRLEISPLDSIFLSQQVIHAGLVSLDPRNGAIRAWVGGNNISFYQYDHVLAQRQAGSTFKPLVYATALEMGIEPCEYVSNDSIVFEDNEGWSPGNVDGNYDGYYSMAGALAHSVNTVSAHYINLTGILPVLEVAHKAGIHSPLPRVPSIALGTADVSLLEMTSAFTPFVNKGNSQKPFWLLKIEDKNGKVIYDNRPSRETPVFSESTALMSRQMLSSVVDSGTAAQLRNRFGITDALAGKTGTTQHGADTWFVGFSPGLITGVWTGVENPAFAGIYKTPLSSTNSAVPVWGEYYRMISENTQTREYNRGSFTPLPDSLAIKLQCNMFLEELPSQSWWEKIFSRPDDGTPEPKPRDEEQPSRFRRWLDRVF